MTFIALAFAVGCTAVKPVTSTAPAPTASDALPIDDAESEPIELATGGPLTDWFVGDGWRFGTSPPSRATLAIAFSSQREIAAAKHRVAYDAATAEETGDVFVIKLNDAFFTLERQVDVYLEAVLRFRASSEGESVMLGPYPAWIGQDIASYRDGGVAVIVDGPGAADVIADMAKARAGGDIGPAVGSTPLRSIDAESVFVRLTGSRFVTLDAEPDGATATTKGTQPVKRPKLPAIAGSVGFPVTRLIGIGNDERGVAYSVEFDPEVAGSAEALDAILDRAADAAGVAAAPIVIGDVRIRVVVTPLGPLRVFRSHNVGVFAFGDDETTLQSIVAEWVGVLAESEP